MSLTLTWVKGLPINGQTYYVEAQVPGGTLTVCKVMVGGEERFDLWLAYGPSKWRMTSKWVQTYRPEHGGRKAALADAERVADDLERVKIENIDPAKYRRP